MRASKILSRCGEILVLFFCWCLCASGTEFNVPSDALPPLLANGDILNLYDGAVLPDFPDNLVAEAGSLINVFGGEFGGRRVKTRGQVNVFGGNEFWPNAEGAASEVNLHSGFLSHATEISSGATLNVYGGETGFLLTMSEATLNLYDGVVGDSVSGFRSQINIFGGTLVGFEGIGIGLAELNMTGGKISHSFLVYFDAVMTMSGGALEQGVGAKEGGEVHLIGKEFYLDGSPIAGLGIGDTVVVNERNVSLTGILADGSAIQLNIADNFDLPSYFAPDGILRLTRVPEPTSVSMLLLVSTCLLALRRELWPMRA